jgi:antitoxin component YwqK of YwqJK toxin-antitoxin module
MLHICFRLSIIYGGFFFMFMQPLDAQTKEFYNIHWEKIDSSDRAAFYRIIKKIDTRFKISDYYITNEIQFDGYALNTTNPLILDDTARYFYKHGGIHIQSLYKKGKRDGYTYHFYPSGKVKSRYHYNQDTLNGEYSSYFPWGETRMIGNYKNNEAVGKYRSYYINGRIELEQEIINPLNSTIKEYDWTGNLKVNTIIRNGQVLYDSIRNKEVQVKPGIGPQTEKEFFSSNNCTHLDSGIKALQVTACRKKFNQFTVCIIKSKQMINLRTYMKNLKIGDNEIYFLYSTDKNETSWRMSVSLKEAFRSSILSYFSIIDILETQLYSPTAFSSQKAAEELYKEIYSDTESMAR